MWVLALWLCRKNSTTFSSQTRTASDAFSDSNPCKITDSKMGTIDAGRAICRKCVYSYSAFGGAKTSKTGPTKSGGMSTVTWPAWNLGCIVHGTHPNISYCRMWHVCEISSRRWQQRQWSIARYFWQGKGPRIWKFLVTPLCTSILGFQLLSFLVSPEMLQLKDFNTRSSRSQIDQSRDPCWTWFSYTETVQRRALQRNSNM